MIEQNQNLRISVHSVVIELSHKSIKSLEWDSKCLVLWCGVAGFLENLFDSKSSC